MPVGTVKWFNDAKGFGFIEAADGGPDVFAHFSAVQMAGFRSLRQGYSVSYELVQGPKGCLAQNIVPLSPEPAAATTDLPTNLAATLATGAAPDVPNAPNARA